jgi:hypothetical protein
MIFFQYTLNLHEYVAKLYTAYGKYIDMLHSGCMNTSPSYTLPEESTLPNMHSLCKLHSACRKCIAKNALILHEHIAQLHSTFRKYIAKLALILHEYIAKLHSTYGKCTESAKNALSLHK